jgi:hypothetical protein
VPTAGGAWCSARETSGAGPPLSDPKSDDLLSWVTECFGIDGAALSIGALTGGAALRSDAAFWALSSDDEAACGGAAMSEVGEPVSSLVAPASVSASGATTVDAAARFISETAEVVSSVAAPMSDAAFGAGAANDTLACCDNVLSADDPLTGSAPLALAATSSRYEDGIRSPRLTDNAEPVAEGSGVGIGVASAGAGRADSAGAVIRCVC